MKNPILASVLAALFSGAIAAGVAVSILVPWEGTSTSAAAPRTIDPGELQTEIAALRKENRLLAQRLDDLENRPVTPAATRHEVAAVPTSDDELREELQKVVSSLIDPNAPVDVHFEAKVTAALESIREQEELERDQRQQEATEKRLEEQLQRLTETLGLDSYQVAGMRDIALSAYDAREELVQRMRETEDFAGMREGFREMRDSTELAIRNLLSPTQYEDYEKTDGLRIGGGRDFRGFRDFGGGGGGGGGRRRGD